MAIIDEERIPFDEDAYLREKRKRFRSGVVKAYGAMLFYGGVVTIVFHLLRFAVNAVVEYFFYKDETTEVLCWAICLIAFVLLVGLRIVEPFGYTDARDDCFEFKSGYGRVAASIVLMLIIPYLVALRVNFLLIYVYNLCYTHSNMLSEFISEGFLHKYEGTTPLGIFLGTTITFLFFLLALIPFYYLGRRNYKRDNERVEAERDMRRKEHEENS